MTIPTRADGRPGRQRIDRGGPLGRSAVMNDDEEFSRRVGAVVARFLAQNARPAPSAGELAAFSARLRALINERGLPRPLAPGETGAPGGMAEADCAALVARVVTAGADPLLAEAARQLVKACFYPEFTECRDSYCETAKDGACRRQEEVRARGRISGSHCVDCPHWTALEPTAHADFLARAWRGNPEIFAQHRDVFLPEDFRALRRWLHAAARADGRGAAGS